MRANAWLRRNRRGAERKLLCAEELFTQLLLLHTVFLSAEAVEFLNRTDDLDVLLRRTARRWGAPSRGETELLARARRGNRKPAPARTGAHFLERGIRRPRAVDWQPL